MNNKELNLAALKLLAIEVKDLLANYDNEEEIEQAQIECLRTLVFRADIKAGKVRNY